MNYRPDMKDKRILYQLDQNCRVSNKEIAKKISLSEQVVGNRIKNLKEKNIIDYFYVRVNTSILGLVHVKIYLRLHNLSPQKETDMLNYLKNKNDIFWLAKSRGKYDLVCSFYVKHLQHFSKTYEEIFKEWEDYILEKNIIVLEKAKTYTRSHFLEDKSRNEITYAQDLTPVIKIDDFDIELLKILNKNARRSLIEIARELDVSSDKIRYRINNLMKMNIITGFGTKINFENLGYNYNIISLKFQNLNSESQDKLNKLIKLNNNILVYINTIGSHDIELEVETKSNEELDNLITSLREEFTYQLKNYEILEIVKEYRITYYPF